MECEIAYRIGKDLTGGSYTRDQVADAIDALVPLVEIGESRLAERKDASIGWRLADGGGNGALLVGEPIRNWRSIDIHKQPVTLTFNGEKVAEAQGSSQPDLIEVVALLVNQAGKHCGGVRAGQVVTTGSMTGNIPAKAGTQAIAAFRNLGELRASFG